MGPFPPLHTYAHTHLNLRLNSSVLTRHSVTAGGDGGPGAGAATETETEVEAEAEEEDGPALFFPPWPLEEAASALQNHTGGGSRDKERIQCARPTRPSMLPSNHTGGGSRDKERLGNRIKNARPTRP